MYLFSETSFQAFLKKRKSVKQLWLIHSAAAKVLTKSKGNDPTKATQKSFHWIPVNERTELSLG